MKAVLDEGVPRQLIPVLLKAGCRVDPFPNRWKGLKNGQLLERLAREGFECLVTSDRSMRYQQNLNALGPAVVVLPGQTLDELTSLAAEISATISTARMGVLVEMPRPGLRPKP